MNLPKGKRRYIHGEQKDKSKIRNYKYHTNPRGEVTGITYQKITSQSPNDVNDYKKIIATTTDGLTKIGQKLLQQSIESYGHAVLGAQASDVNNHYIKHENSHSEHKRRPKHGYLPRYDTSSI